MPFQVFLPQTESVTFPVRDFDESMAAVAENEIMTGEGVEVELARDEEGQADNCLALVAPSTKKIRTPPPAGVPMSCL